MIEQQTRGSLDMFTDLPGGGSARPLRAADNGREAELGAIVRSFTPITLAEMNGVALQDRIDTKYVLGVTRLERTLAQLTEHYRILDISGVRLNHYQTLYFDTADFTLYNQHHAGRRNRCKVRSRSYVDSNLKTLEVKTKLNGSRTVKTRIETPDLVTRITPLADEFVRQHLPANLGEIVPQLWNNFTRITLVSLHHQERLTLDVDISFTSLDAHVALPGIAIAEVKQAGRARTSSFMGLMRREGIRSSSISKYCVGATLLYPELKHNNFLAQQRQLRKLAQGGLNVTH